MTARLKLTPLCAEFGMAHGRAKQLLQQAGVEPDSRKIYDADEAREVLAANIDPQVAIGNRIAGRGNGGASIEKTALAASRLKTEEARYTKIALENDLKSGKLIRRDLVEKAGVEFAAHMQSGLLGFAPRIAPRLVGKTATTEIIAILDTEIRRVLSDLSNIDTWLEESYAR